MAPFRSCISKNNNIFIDNLKEFDIVMPMYNLLEYSENFSRTPSLRNYSRDEVDNGNDNDSDGKSFKDKRRIKGKTEAGSGQPGNERDVDRPTQPPVASLNVEVTIALKYLSNS